MAVRSPREEETALLQQAGDQGGGVDDRRSRERAQAIQISSLGIHGRDDGKPLPAAEIEVLESASGRDVDDPGAFLRGDVRPGNHAMLDAPLQGHVVEGPLVAQSHELRALDRSPRRTERRVASDEAGGDGSRPCPRARTRRSRAAAERPPPRWRAGSTASSSTRAAGGPADPGAGGRR
jgi:hypothetical protein